MTISSETTRNDYTGNGVTTEFAYSFRIWSNTDLTVVTADEDGVESVLELTTDYTVTGAGQTTGGNVTLLTPLADGHKLTILSDIPALQGQKLSTQSGFSASVQEASLDKLTRITQQNAEAISRSARLSPTSQGIDPVMPIPLAGAAIGWNADGGGLENITSLGGLSESALATLIRLYSALRGNSDTKYKIVSGVIRQTSSGSGWELIDDANHSPVNVDSVSVNGSGNLSISYASIGAANKAYFSAWPDETFAGWGMRMGCSVGNTSATIEIYAPYGGAIVASSATPVQPIIPLGHVVTQTLDTAKGTLVVAHETQSHSSGNGSPVSVVASGNNGMWTVTSTKSDFTLTYRRQCVGAISWSGGNPSANTAIAYPGPYNVTATASSSGKIRLDIGTHELYAGMAVDVASVTGTTEANDRWYIDSAGSGYIVLGNSVTTDLPSAYVNPWVSGGTVTMVKVLWKTDHIEVFHPYAGSQQFVQCQMHKGTTWLDCKIDNTSITTYGFHAYFYDNAGTLVSSSSSDMKFSYQRDVRLPATIPASNVGQVTRDNIHCDANGIYNANGNIWFCGIFEVE